MPRPELIRGRRRWAGLVALLLACAPSCLPAQADRGQKRPDPEIRHLVLNGVKGVDSYDLRKSISTTGSECRSLLLVPFCALSKSPLWVQRHYLDHDELARDVLRMRVYYWKRGYREATVDTTVVVENAEKNQVKVTFNVVEGAPTLVQSIRVAYDSLILPLKRVTRITRELRAGKPLNLIALDTARYYFQQEMWNRGYGDAAVDTATSANAETRQGTVDITVVPNRRTTVGTITVKGNNHITPLTIQNTIALRPSGLYKRDDVIESQRNLYESNLFRQATIVVPPQKDSVKNLLISVSESPLHEGRVSFGFNNIDFLQADGRFTDYNFIGGARRLDINGVIGNLGASTLNGKGFFRKSATELNGAPAPFLSPTWLASIEFKQPAWLSKPPNAFGLSAFAHRRAAPGIYIDRGYGGAVTFTHNLRIRAPLSGTYRYEQTKVEASDVYFCVYYGVCDLSTIGQLRGHRSLSPAIVSAYVDRTDAPFTPTKGYIGRLDLEHASNVTMSDYRYNRLFLEASAYTHYFYPSTKVLAGHLKMGWVQPLTNGDAGISVLHPRKRFYAGGAQSVRGYGENQLGPRILTVPPSELASATAIGGGKCDVSSAATVATCDPNTIKQSFFTSRPIGGTSLLEGSVEWRTPVARKVTAAVFLDAGVVGSNSLVGVGNLRNLARGSGAVTPGAGIRYASPAGPIRIDIGFNPSRTENLTVVTSVTQNGVVTLVPLTTMRSFSPTGSSNGIGKLLNRLTLHLSIGEAY
ncbi:MAG: surface antigen [Gemmatimonadetes bacterium]|nr:surface antigen [Gemmatimonadota bacterium]